MTQPIVHVVGSRPNFMKLAPVHAALAELGIDQRIVHTGQHYDRAMSDIFFEEFELPDPAINLGVGSGTHAAQTAALLVGIENVLDTLRPALLMVYGDVNSTMAAALSAAKLGVRIAHVEAGLRSGDRSMPEEINRLVTDVLADVLFVTAPEGLENLAREGVPTSKIHHVGNPMIDTLMRMRPRFESVDTASGLGVVGDFGVVTMHRPGNVDDVERHAAIIEGIAAVSGRLPLVFPVHPRAAERGITARLGSAPDVTLVAPLGYVDFMSLVSRAAVVITDSGGVQEETTFLGVPCVTVRENTERPVTLTRGTNRLVQPAGLVTAVVQAVEEGHRSVEIPLWDGEAGRRIADIVRGL